MPFIGNKPSAVPLTSADIADNIITSAKIVDGTIVNSDISTTSAITLNKLSGNPNFRNIVINGDMQIAQRSTSVASITTSGYYTLDRWNVVLSSLGTFTMSQSTDVPTGQGFASSLKLDCTTADASPAAGDIFFIQQKIEGQNLQYLKKGTANAVSLTASFWVKSTKTGTFIVEFYDYDNGRQVSKSYTVNVSNTWEFKTVTFPADTTGAFGNDNGLSANLIFWLGAGSTYSSGTLNTSWGSTVFANQAAGQVNIADSTSNDFLITGVQLEAGTSATDFEFLPIDVDLARCARYYYKFGDMWINTQYARFGGADGVSANNLQFKTRMRANPSYTHGTAGNNVASRRGSTNADFTIASAEGANTDSLNMTIYNGGGGLSWSAGTAFPAVYSNLEVNSEL